MTGEIVRRSQRPRDLRQDVGRIVHRGEPDPEDTVPVLADELGRGLDGEARLAGSAGAGERDQTGIADERDHICDLAFATDEAGAGAGKVGVRDRLQRRERPIAELVDPDLLVEVLEPVLAEVVDVEVDQVAGRAGQDDLAAVPGSGHARGEVHVEADVPLLRPSRRPGVQSHAYPQRTVRERVLRLSRGGGRLARVGEHEEEGVPLRVHLFSAVGAECVAEEAAVLGQHSGVPKPQLAEQARRALDVCEQHRRLAHASNRSRSLPRQREMRLAIVPGGMPSASPIVR